MLQKIVTIGVYGFDGPTFFAALQRARVDTFVDIRRRRGVRGGDYAFANSTRLQQGLAELAIRYAHLPELAPTDDLRELQRAEDRRTGTSKRARTQLSPAFLAAFRERRLAALQPEQIVAALAPGAHIAAFCCVERDPAACHRSMVAAWLADRLGVEVEDLRP